ncbi:MAG: PAS domain S-box protein [Planctomycetes bacterium]|nr:PAS domain S-box protein [Planctomycetota bacterium]
MPRVLLVENSSKQAQELRSILEGAGFEVEACPDAERGLERLAAGRFDLVLTSLFLRGATGFDLCRRVKGDPKWRRTSVILLSRWASPNSVLRGLEVGADGFMSKGLEPADIVARVRRVLAHGAWPPPSQGASPTPVVYRDQEFELTAGREQLVEVLLSAFEDVVRLEQEHREAIDELRRTEQTLRESEARYRSLVTATSQIIWTTNAAGDVVTDLPAWRAFTGQTEDEIKGQGWLDAVHPGDRVRTAQIWSRAVATKCFFETECQVRRYDGTYRDFSVRGVPVLEGDNGRTHFWQGPDFSLYGVPLVEESGRIREWVGTCTDITERKRAQDELQENEKRTRLIIDTARDAFIAIDAQGRIIDWNPQAELTFGWSRSEAIGRSVAETIIPEQHRAAHHQGLERFLATGEGQFLNRRIEITALHRDGHEFAVELTLSPVRLGDTYFFNAFVHDITERKQADRALRDAEALYHSLVESLPMNVFRKDLKSRFTFANQLFCDSLGKLLEEIVGKTDFDFYPSELADKYRGDDRRVAATREPMEAVEEHQKPTGEKLYVEVRKTPVYDAKGDVVGTQCLFWDVTARMRAELEREQTAAELARSNKELEQFAYVASHDLQEPLRMVASYTQLLARRYKDKLDADAHEFIAFAVDGASRMQKMIKELLALSRVSTMGRPFTRTNCTAVFNAAVLNLKRAIDVSGAAVTCDPLPTVLGDVTQLGQLFQNLISNGIKFHGAEPPRVHVSAEPQNNDWVFSIRDNGIGIDPDSFDRIFVMFERLHSRQDYPGVGMGLAICKKIIERHGGRIWVESQPGTGATFCFTIPVQRS